MFTGEKYFDLHSSVVLLKVNRLSDLLLRGVFTFQCGSTEGRQATRPPSAT